MQSYHKHIALLFLGGFLFPQVAGSMHYFVVSHDFSSEKNNSFHTPEPDSLFHSCVYHFNGFSIGIIPQNVPEILINFYPPATFGIGSLEDYVHRDDFNFLLRGPPFENVFTRT